jgi:hypothetical protein
MYSIIIHIFVYIYVFYCNPPRRGVLLLPIWFYWNPPRRGGSIGTYLGSIFSIIHQDSIIFLYFLYTSVILLEPAPQGGFYCSLYNSIVTTGGSIVPYIYGFLYMDIHIFVYIYLCEYILYGFIYIIIYIIYIYIELNIVIVISLYLFYRNLFGFYRYPISYIVTSLVILVIFYMVIHILLLDLCVYIVWNILFIYLVSIISGLLPLIYGFFLYIYIWLFVFIYWFYMSIYSVVTPRPTPGDSYTLYMYIFFMVPIVTGSIVTRPAGGVLLVYWDYWVYDTILYWSVLYIYLYILFLTWLIILYMYILTIETIESIISVIFYCYLFGSISLVYLYIGLYWLFVYMCIIYYFNILILCCVLYIYSIGALLGGTLFIHFLILWIFTYC